MKFGKSSDIGCEMIALLGEYVRLESIELGKKAYFNWPSIIHMMKFRIHQYQAVGFGNIFTMDTLALGGMMKLFTLVATPNLGGDVPLLILDIMTMKKKKVVFVEFYDCTEEKKTQSILEKNALHYQSIPDYKEEDAWYQPFRTSYSLIKTTDDENLLYSMVKDMIATYGETCQLQTDYKKNNRSLLHLFIDRMVKEGNPSSATLNRVFGKEQASQFFYQYVMPKQYQCVKKEIEK